jgi:hypothetical protein
MKTLQLPKYKTTHAHAPESTVDVVVFLFYVLNFRFYRTPKQTILARAREPEIDWPSNPSALKEFTFEPFGPN